MNLFIFSNKRHFKTLSSFGAQGLIKKSETKTLFIKKNNGFHIETDFLIPLVHSQWRNAFNFLFGLLKIRRKFKRVYICNDDYATISLLSYLKFDEIYVYDDGIGVLKLSVLINEKKLKAFKKPSKIARFVFGCFLIKYEVKVKTSKILFFSKFSKLLEKSIPKENIVHLPSPYLDYRIIGIDDNFLIGQPFIEALRYNSKFIETLFHNLKEKYGPLCYLPHPNEKETLAIAKNYFTIHDDYYSFAVFDERKILPSNVYGFFSTILFEICNLQLANINVNFICSYDRHEFFKFYAPYVADISEENKVYL